MYIFVNVKIKAMKTLTATKKEFSDLLSRADLFIYLDSSCNFSGRYEEDSEQYVSFEFYYSAAVNSFEEKGDRWHPSTTVNEIVNIEVFDAKVHLGDPMSWETYELTSEQKEELVNHLKSNSEII